MKYKYQKRLKIPITKQTNNIFFYITYYSNMESLSYKTFVVYYQVEEDAKNSYQLQTQAYGGNNEPTRAQIYAVNW